MQISQIISQTLFLWSLSTNYNFGADTPQLFTFCKLSSTSTTAWLAGLQNVKEQLCSSPPNGIRLSQHQRKVTLYSFIFEPQEIPGIFMSPQFSSTYISLYVMARECERGVGNALLYSIKWDRQAI